MWGAAALLVALVAGLAVACGDDGTVAEAPTATPAATELPPEGEEPGPDDGLIGEPPPTLTIAAGQDAIEAGLGSYCWKFQCLDRYTTTPAEPLAAMGATALEAVLASETIAEVSIQATSTADLTSELLESGLLAWTGGDGESVDLPATVDGGTLQVDISTLEAGQFLVTFFVRFESGGDASYGAILDVSDG